MGRPVVHWELWSEDPERIANFYQAAFDWQIRPIPDLNYRLVETGGTGGINGGIMKPQRGPWPGKLAFYIDVDDLDQYAKRIVKGRGQDSGGQNGCSRRRPAFAVRRPGWPGARHVEAGEIASAH